jgi:hypothetical protein
MLKRKPAQKNLSQTVHERIHPKQNLDFYILVAFFSLQEAKHLPKTFSMPDN